LAYNEKKKYENKPEVGPLEFMELTQTLIQKITNEK
jgi:hypothetical protein